MAQKPEWHEESHPSDSSVVEGVASPMAFADRKRVALAYDVADLIEGVKAGDRMRLARAITLMESTAPAHRAMAEELMAAVYPLAGKSLRVGITGVPGVGKSSFIEAMGMRITAKGRKLAVLTIDPSSELTGGSILGDKTRMEKLSCEPNAFIRPSPSRGVLGGVARWTREAMILCEAAGYDTLFIETVGVGQSEVLVRSMVDCFLLLALAGAGDELQGIKKGIMELADLIAVTKADGDNAPKALAAAAQLERVLAYIPAITPGWSPKVLATSAFEGTGLDSLWSSIEDFATTTHASGAFATRRTAQLEGWLKTLLRDALEAALKNHPELPTWLAAAHKRLPMAVAREAIKKLAPWE